LSALRRLDDETAGVCEALAAMRAPWLDAQNTLRSMGGFVELQRIGLSLSNLPSFNSDLTERLRLNFGDWRAAIEWPRDIFTDVAVRTAFYESRGLDLRLTDFPAAAFEQGAALAGLTASPPALLELCRTLRYARRSRSSARDGGRSGRPPALGNSFTRSNVVMMRKGAALKNRPEGDVS
jgi:hypothetical protein